MNLKNTVAKVGDTVGHIMRPARYAGAGVKGTFWGGLEGMAQHGRKGLWAGLGLGIFVGMATGGIGNVVMFALGGFAAGAAMGTIVGAVQGGFGHITREARRDKYADEVAERQVAREARAARTQNTRNYTYRDVHSRRQNINNYNFERQLQQERENDNSYNNYWQDRVGGQSNGNGRGF